MNKFKPGDRIVHKLYGEGVVINHPSANRMGVPVVFDSGYTRDNSWGYLAGPGFLTKSTPLIQENE